MLSENKKVVTIILDKEIKLNPFSEFIGKLDDKSAHEMLEALDECRQIEVDEILMF